MDTIDRSEEINHHRSRFFGTAAITIAAAQLGMTGCVDAEAPGKRIAGVMPVRPGAATSLGPLKQIDAGLLNAGCAEAGPTDDAASWMLLRSTRSKAAPV